MITMLCLSKWELVKIQLRISFTEIQKVVSLKVYKLCSTINSWKKEWIKRFILEKKIKERSWHDELFSPEIRGRELTFNLYKSVKPKWMQKLTLLDTGVLLKSSPRKPKTWNFKSNNFPRNNFSFIKLIFSQKVNILLTHP